MKLPYRAMKLGRIMRGGRKGRSEARKWGFRGKRRLAEFLWMQAWIAARL